MFMKKPGATLLGRRPEEVHCDSVSDWTGFEPPLAPQCRPPSVQSCVVCKGHGCLELRFKCQQPGKDSHSLFGLYLYPVCRET